MYAQSEDDFRRMIDRLAAVGEEYGLRVNVNKTKVMAVSRLKVRPNVRITLICQEIEQVKQFRFLGSIISEDGKCDVEVRRRIPNVNECSLPKLP